MQPASTQAIRSAWVSIIAGDGIGDVHVDPVARVFIGNDVDLIRLPHKGDKTLGVNGT